MSAGVLIGILVGVLIGGVAAVAVLVVWFAWEFYFKGGQRGPGS